MKAFSVLSNIAFIILASAMPAAAGSYQIYVNDGDVVIDHSRSRRQTITREIIIEQEPTVIIERPIVITQPTRIYPDTYYYGYPSAYTQVISAPANRCWYQADPYTFLGDVFGYDYDLICY